MGHYIIVDKSKFASTFPPKGNSESKSWKAFNKLRINCCISSGFSSSQLKRGRLLDLMIVSGSMRFWYDQICIYNLEDNSSSVNTTFQNENKLIIEARLVYK